LWEVNDLFGYWQQHPPVHVLVAAYLLGGSDRQRGASKEAQMAGITAAIHSLGGSHRGKLPEHYRSA
jgi:hypothetical protein